MVLSLVVPVHRMIELMRRGAVQQFWLEFRSTQPALKVQLRQLMQHENLA